MEKIKNLQRLQEKLRAEKLDGYIILTSDPHGSEYVAPHFSHERHSVCPFSGSAATILVTQTFAYLWTDGRYFLQAARELTDSGFVLMRAGEKDVPLLEDFIEKEKIVNVATDFSLMPNNYATRVGKKCHLQDRSFIDLYLMRPELSKEKLFELSLDVAGESSAKKIKRIIKVMKEKHAKAHLITSLEDIAWILNFRGHDVSNTPVFYSYLYLTARETILFIDVTKVSAVDTSNIVVKDYHEIDSFLATQNKVKTLVDSNKINAHLSSLLKKKIESVNPSYLFKAVKNKVELENNRRIHIYDGVAMVKMMAYLSKNANSIKLNEYDLGVTLEDFRRENKACYDLSFSSIVAYNENGAQMHYSAKKDSAKEVTGDGLLLIDSGGQYIGGTTDITRTFAIGTPSEIMKRHYTLTLKSLISLSTSVFLTGCSGVALDIKAREIMWKEGLDYKCGTGHGVGYMLSVHEGPQGFRYKLVAERDDHATLQVGNVTTVEPGVYLENQYGIRLENELVTKVISTNGNDIFLGFETITYCPFDKKCLDRSLLTVDEIDWINAYHREVYHKLKDYFVGNEETLKRVTEHI